MDRLDELRQQAVLRRNRALTAAREEYRDTIASIDRLARLFGGGRLKPVHKPLAQIIEECMPNDRAITGKQLYERMEAAEPGRVFPAGSVSSALHTMAKRGVVKRVGVREGNTLWAVKGFKADDPFGAQTVRQVVGALLRELGPLTLAEIVVRLQARGYRPGVDPRAVNDSIRSGLSKCRGEFVRDSKGRWSIVG